MKRILSLLTIISICFTFSATTVTAVAENVNTLSGNDSSQAVEEVVPDNELISLLKEYDNAIEKLVPYLKDENMSTLCKASENQILYDNCRSLNNFYNENNWNDYNAKEKYSYAILNIFIFADAKGCCNTTHFLREERILPSGKLNKEYFINIITNSKNVFLEPSKIEKNDLNEFATAYVNILEWYYDKFEECNIYSNDSYRRILAENMQKYGINVPDPFKTYIKYVVRQEEPKTMETSSNVSSELYESSESETSVITVSGTEISSEIDSSENDSEENYDEDEDEEENKFLRILKDNVVSLIFIVIALVVLVIIAIRKRGR